MNDPLMLALAGAGGFVLGAVFFGGLWWTVRKGVSARRPALWFVASFLIRMALAVVGFHFIGGGQWQRLLACLLGFVIARFLMVRFLRAPLERRPEAPAKEVHHAP